MGAEREMAPDASLSLCVHGLPACRPRHVSQGALGIFLHAIEDGLMPAGSVLIVEGLDRLSRAEPLEVWSQFARSKVMRVLMPRLAAHVYAYDRWLKVKIEKEIVRAGKIGNAREQTGVMIDRKRPATSTSGCTTL